MTVAARHPDQSFVHEAFLYASPEEFVRGTTAVHPRGLEAGEPVLVVLDAEKIKKLRAELGDEADGVIFADMAEVGANPARIIAAWQEFAEEHGAGGQPIRGIGEPIWTRREASRSSPNATATSRSSISRSRTLRPSGSSAPTTSARSTPRSSRRRTGRIRTSPTRIPYGRARAIGGPRRSRHPSPSRSASRRLRLRRPPSTPTRSAR